MHEKRPSSGFWGSLTEGERAALAQRGRESVFARGVPLCVEGDPATHLYVILAGWVKVVQVTVDGDEMFLALRGPGDIIGELAGALDGYRTATVRAVVAVRALSVIAERFMAFLAVHQGAARAYMRLMAERNRESSEILRGRMETNGAQRLARLVLDLAARCGEATAEGVTLAIPLPQHDLASWVGVSRATVTRALRQWRDRKLITMRNGRMVVIDPVTLRQISRNPPDGG